MLINLCAILLLVLSMVAVITSKYNPDNNSIIKRLHGSTHAKRFLHGCDAEPYSQLAENKNESQYFQLQQSKEYLFAIFTLDEVSIILSNTNETRAGEDIVLFNITLGINKNSMAMLEVFVNGTISNITQEIVPILPTIPYYVNISITDSNISVYEARIDAAQPFLYINLNSTIDLSSATYFVKFKHLSGIYAHYDCCEVCTPWIYTRMSGCSKYSARTASTKSETTHPIVDNNSSNRTENVLFNENILINHDGSPTFAAKIIFSEFDSVVGNRYEIGLSDTPTILHFVNSSAQHTTTLDPGVTLKRQYTLPFIVNITITRGKVYFLNLRDMVVKLEDKKQTGYCDFMHVRSIRSTFACISYNSQFTHYYVSKAHSNATRYKQDFIKRKLFSLIHQDGVSLRQPYEDSPFLYYVPRFQKLKLKPVNVKYMTMLKFHEDFIRYDFFYNCTELLCFTKKHELIDKDQPDDSSDSEFDHRITSSTTESTSTNTSDTDTNSYPRIWEYVSKQFQTMKYDVLHVFQDSYQIYEKSRQLVSEDNSQYEDETITLVTKSGKASDATKNNDSSKSNGFSDTIKKGVVGVSSFLLIGILKFVFSLGCVKNLMKEADVDDDKAKDLRKNMGNLFNKNVADSFGLGDE